MCNVVACFNTQTNEPEAIEAVDVQDGVRVTQTVIRGSSTVKSSMLPYVPSRRVTTAQLGVWFQGSHKTKIEDHHTTTRYHISPMYQLQDMSGTVIRNGLRVDQAPRLTFTDFESFQEVLLRRKVISCIDARKISINATDCHSNSAEAIRILEDPISKGLSLLYFASFPGTSRRARFMDVPSMSTRVMRDCLRRLMRFSERSWSAHRQVEAGQIRISRHLAARLHGQHDQCPLARV